MIHRYSCLWITGVSGVDGVSDPLFRGEGGGGKIPCRKGTRQDIPILSFSIACPKLILWYNLKGNDRGGGPGKC